MFTYKVINDGWMKIPSDGFPVSWSSANSNRLLIGLNQLLVRINGKNILIDTGIGTKYSASQLGLIDYQTPRRLIDELSAEGLQPVDIDIVILTHLHYDHSGGGTRYNDDGRLASTFTNALYYIQERELRFAQNPDADRKDDYRLDDVEPLISSGQLVVIDGDKEIVDGVTVYFAPGHSPGHQVVLIQSNGITLFFQGDLFSTKDHANLSVITDYDHNPEQLLTERRKWLERTVANQWECLFCHAIRNPVGKVDYVR